jgi:tetratricopeptide (TPR) repeat protein
VQRQIRSKDYANAVKRLDELEKDFPHYSIIYELKGSAFYLDKQFKQALNYYRKAFSVNPENRDAYIMKVYLEEKFELKPAAGTNG